MTSLSSFFSLTSIAANMSTPLVLDGKSYGVVVTGLLYIIDPPKARLTSVYVLRQHQVDRLGPHTRHSASSNYGNVRCKQPTSMLCADTDMGPSQRLLHRVQHN